MTYQGNWTDEHCILCGERAIFTDGHYHHKGKLIIAGWCSKHHCYKKADYFLPVKGCETKGEGCFGDDGELELLIQEIMIEDERKRLLKNMGYENV